MMTTNLFVIANVKQLRTGSFRILLPLLITSAGGGVPNSEIQQKMTETRSLVRLLRMYFPRKWEFGSAFSKLLNPSPLGTPLQDVIIEDK
jgi:hypothetical protein